MGKNLGEYDELRIKLRLIELRDQNTPITIDGRNIHITSVGLEREFSSLPVGTNLRTMNDNQIEILADCVGAGKSPGDYKADVLINGIGYSVKSGRSTPPAIVNHTPRWGWYGVCQRVGASIDGLDMMVSNYFKLRKAGKITEDVQNSDKNSPFANHITYLRPLLNYFIFKGSGKGDSEYPAKYVLNGGNVYNINTWRIYDETDYLDTVWDDLVFSMREKGFTSYPYRRSCDKWKNEYCKPWAIEFNGLLKGSLHVRVKEDYLFINKRKEGSHSINKKSEKSNSFKFIDLFSGIGGFHQGASWAGGKCVMASDIDEIANKTYKENYGIEPKGDIYEIKSEDIPDFDLLCAGFPCQSFSQVGQKKGFEDNRGLLIFQVLRILQDKQPRAFILENVPGLLSIQHGEIFNHIIEKLKEVGYNVYTKVLESKDYGTPQIRKRLFFVGIRKDIKADFEFPAPVPLKYTFSEIMGGKTEREYSFTIRIGGRRSGIDNRFNWDAYVVDGKVRYITPEECLLLHGFPKGFKLCGNESQRYHQVGNSVSCCIVNELVKQLQKCKVLRK